ncbi:formate dehydrogenase subunit gamma [Striga asiatica]|uniref:Formate dehydrogenase subunit gamma n=1 Tax=Striga asiatica TaxID=4170 RepID=A0A5A7RK07_STRAF|nr:formate dehydrogenase subunit gamma [Striga asiatica]
MKLDTLNSPSGILFPQRSQRIPSQLFPVLLHHQHRRRPELRHDQQVPDRPKLRTLASPALLAELRRQLALRNPPHHVKSTAAKRPDHISGHVSASHHPFLELDRPVLGYLALEIRDKLLVVRPRLRPVINVDSHATPRGTRASVEHEPDHV